MCSIVISCADLRDDEQFFMDHAGAVPISTAQVKTTASPQKLVNV